MDIIFLATIAALSYLIILSKVFGIPFIVKTQVLWDILFTFGIPCLFLGTFSGMSTAFISGVLFSGMTWFLGILQPKKEKSISL